MSFNDSEFFNVQIENYNGPLDVLLDLAKAQKVNLEKISITRLADQFNDYIKNEKNLNLDTASEYLLMASWLAYLKSKFENIEIKKAPPRPGDVMHTQADVSESSEAFGYTPNVKFWDGLEMTLKWWELC